MATTPTKSSSAVSSPPMLADPLPTLQCACGLDAASFRCQNGGKNDGKFFVRCRQKICFTWIWEEQLRKFVDEMVESKTGAQIRALREALEQATNQVLSKDHELELMCAQLASTNVKMDETSRNLKSARMQVWGLFFLCVVMFIAMNQS